METQSLHVGIVGAGTMGVEVAWACRRAGHATVLYDPDDRALERATHELRSDNVGPPLSFAQSLRDAVVGMDVVFENVPEILEIKQSVHAAIEPFLEEHAIQGSNSSALKGSSIAPALQRPERLFNANFDHPRAGGRLVELMPHAATSLATLDRARSWLHGLGMIPIMVRREITGYAQNRIWRAVKREAMRLVDAEHSTVDDIDRGFCLLYGVSEGPFATMDRIGLETVLKIEETYFAESGLEEDRPTQLLRDLVARGRIGVRTGGGFYDYPNPSFGETDWLVWGPDEPKDELRSREGAKR